MAEITRMFSTWNLTGIGSAAALTIAVWQGLGAPAYSSGDDEIAASINGVDITTSELAVAVEAIRQDKKGGLTPKDRKRALDTLIKEELLVQRAVELGLFESDRGIRKAAVDAMLQFAMTRADSVPTDEVLRAWFEDRKMLFTKKGLIRAAFARTDNLEDAGRLAEKIGRTDFHTAVAEDPWASIQSVPDTLLFPAKLRDYVGPKMVLALQDLTVGDMAGPYPDGNGSYVFVWLKERTDTVIPRFEDVYDAVADMWARENREKAVMDYMDTLWRQAKIETPEKPKGFPDK